MPKEPSTLSKNRTQEQLLIASLSAFGNKDYDAVSTREIVELAGANISSISYHFGGKHPLYLATAAYLANSIRQEMQGTLDTIRTKVEEKNRDPAICRALLKQFVEALVHNVLQGKLSADAAGFIFREQLKPTEAFDILYQELMEPMLSIYAGLLSCLFEQSDSDREIKLMTHALLGQILIFRIGQTTILRRLDSSQFSNDDCKQITELITQQTFAAIDQRLQSTS